MITLQVPAYNTAVYANAVAAAPAAVYANAVAAAPAAVANAAYAPAYNQVRDDPICLVKFSYYT